MNLGALKRIDARQVWTNEGSDFTPWLARNLGALGEAIGIDLELKSTEAPVGGFSLDILARDLNRDRLVVVENQLSPTDHDHLGKLLTYASGYDAATIVWLAPEFRDEHRQTLDWLNQHTDTGTEFFGVVVEVLQIDDSLPAPDFKVVAAPNQWRKAKVNAGAEGSTSARGEAYRSFFQDLLDELREMHKFTGARVAQPANWLSFSSGRSGITYGAVFGGKGRIRTELYIDVGEEAANKGIFDALHQERDQIEQALGETLNWERLEGRRASRISISRAGQVEASAEELGEIHRWFVEKLLRFKEIFGPRITSMPR